MVVNQFFSIFGLPNYFRHRHAQRILIGAGLLVMAFAIGCAYYFYRINQEETAQSTYALCVQEIKRAETQEISWADAELACKTGYVRHAHSSLAPYFLALQSYALMQQEKNAEGLKLMQKMVKQLPLSSPFYYWFKVKNALMKVDSSDAQQQQDGLQELESLSHDVKNNARDYALFNLAMYYKEHNNLQKADSIIKELTSSFPLEGPEASVWAEQAIRLRQ